MHIYLHLGNYQTQITDSYKQTLKQMLVSVLTVQICFSQWVMQAYQQQNPVHLRRKIKTYFLEYSVAFILSSII